MYISLYTVRQLRHLKNRLFWLGLFLACGGGSSVMYNAILQDTIRWVWAIAAAVVLLAGLYLIMLAIGAFRMKDTYVCITPLTISYRLHFFSRESVLDWQRITNIQLNESCVLFNLTGGGQEILKLTVIASPHVANRVASSLHEAAIKQNLSVNSFPMLGTARSIY